MAAGMLDITVIILKWRLHTTFFHAHLCMPKLSYSRKISREKTFANFAVLWLFANFSLQNVGAWCPLACKSEQFAKVFSVKIVIFTNSQKFSPSKVFRYTVLFAM